MLSLYGKEPRCKRYDLDFKKIGTRCKRAPDNNMLRFIDRKLRTQMISINNIHTKILEFMNNQIQNLIKKAYHAFNSRDIDTALSTFHPDVEWPKAFEGGYIQGHEEIRKYWTRQWTEINPNVEPVEIIERPDGTLEVAIQQIVLDLQGNEIFNGVVKHVFVVQDDLLRRMDIELN